MIPSISFLLFYNHPTAYYFAQLKQGGLDSVNLLLIQKILKIHLSQKNLFTLKIPNGSRE